MAGEKSPTVGTKIARSADKRDAMYNLNPKSARDFIDDMTIRPPRFQRKLTWGEAKNFRMALSVFRGYPLGTVILHLQDANTKVLLDGRQRRNALEGLQDPEELWRWAKKVLRVPATDGKKAKAISTKTDRDDLIEAFRAVIDDYFGVEDWEREEAAPDGPDADDSVLDSATDEDDESVDEGDAQTEDADSGFAASPALSDEPMAAAGSHPYSSPGLELLLQALLMVHPVTKTKSELTKTFDFSKHVGGLTYIKTIDNAKRVRTSNLLNWISKLPQELRAEGIEQYPPTPDQFADWLLSTYTVISTEDKARLDVATKWPRIEQALRVMNQIDQKLRETIIGYLEIENVGANDEKKIFEIINTEGEPLTAVEILSAKPAWNRVVDSPSDTLVQAKDAMYERMEIPVPSDVVRWDVAATVLERISIPFIFPSTDSGGTAAFERRVTTGFKLMSGYYTGRIQKQDLDAFGARNDVPWSKDEFDKKATKVRDAALRTGLLQQWKSWDVPLANAASDAVAMNFLLVLMKDWDRKGGPTSAGKTRDSFEKNVRILFDRMVFEYITGVWRGSSDTRVARNVAGVEASPNIFPAVSESDWIALIEEVIDVGTIRGDSYVSGQSVSGSVKLLLTYYYCLLGVQGPGAPYDVDHLVPQRLFGSLSSQKEKSLGPLMNNLGNLALLPTKDNVKKSDRTLEELETLPGPEDDREWLITQVEKYSGIATDDFGQYSSVEKVTDLIAARRPSFIDAFSQRRNSKIG